MSFPAKSEQLLKYQKTKAKLVEYSVSEELYPAFPLDSHDLCFYSIYILSRYAESLIMDNTTLQTEIKPLLDSVAQYYDSAFKSKDRKNRDPDFILTGAIAYFYHNDFGSAKALLSSLHIDISEVKANPFWLLVYCLRYILLNKKGINQSESELYTDIFNSILLFFRSGEQTERIISLLKDYKDHIHSEGNPIDVFYVNQLYAVILFAIEKSTWMILPHYSEISITEWKSYLERDDALHILWQAQELVCLYGVLQGKNAIVQLPTGVGKTKSIELIIRAAQLSKRATDIVVVAPLRALCNEITYNLQYAFRKDEVDISQFSDVLEDDFSQYESNEDNVHISICTPEKLNYIIHHDAEFCDMFDLYILDEAHMFDDGIRGVNYEFLVSTIRERLNENQQIVLLSAVMKNVDDIKEWLFGENGIIVSDNRILTTPKSVGFYSKNKIEYYSGDPLEYDFDVPQSIIDQQLKLLKRERAQRVFPIREKAQDIAIYYGILLCKNGGVAVYVDKTAQVRTTIERILDIKIRGIDLRNVTERIDSVEMRKIANLMEQYYGNEHVYTKACYLGVLPHNGRLPNGIKLAVEYALQNRKAYFVVCTSTLAQGVNVPVKYLLIANMPRGYNKISVRSFQNLTGRIARAGMYTEGSIIVADPTLYENKKKNAGLYKWNECRNSFSKSYSEPCTSSILKLCLNIRINYEHDREAEIIVKHILNHYDEKNCFDSLQASIIEYAEENHIDCKKEDIIKQVLERKQVMEAIENHLCFIYGCNEIDYDDVIEGIGAKVCKGTLAYFLANEQQRTMLLELFSVIDEKVRSLNKQQHIKYGTAMTGIRIGKMIENWIEETKIISEPYEEIGLLHLLIGLYNTVYGLSEKEEVIFEQLCNEWIKGTLPPGINAIIPDLSIDKIIEICHDKVSYNMSFLLGNIIDLLPDHDEYDIGDLLASLSNLQKKLKYGVPNQTAISICESLFWDRYIAITIANIIGDEEVDSADLNEYLNDKKNKIFEFLEQMPSCFSERFASAVNKQDSI